MEQTTPVKNRLYRTIWRWHFYAGLFCIPFILTLAVSGSIYLFKPQIDNWIDKPYSQLDTTGTRSTPQQQINAALATLPNSTFASYRLPKNNQEAVVVTLKHQAEQVLVYVHPYTLEVLKQVGYNDQFIRVVRTFHGELLMGKVGSVLVELAGCWAIVMIITGLYLWWPRNASGLAGVVYPRLKTGGRQFWRDLHAVTGFWVSLFTLFLLISGLPWALVWGSAFKEVRSLAKPAIQQNWSISSADELHNHGNENTAHNLILTQSLLEKGQVLNFAHPVEFAPARNKPHQWQLSSQHQNRPLRSNAWFDAKTESLIDLKHFSDKSTVDKVVGIGIAAHEGHLFGWFNQFLSLLTTLGLVLVSVSGFILWRKRKPNGALGAPAVQANAAVTKTVWGITILLALFLPLLAVSLISLTILELCLFRYIPSLRKWLGLRQEPAG